MLESGLPEKVVDDEDLARFLTQSGHFSRERVKPAAFLPDRTSRETSVSRHGRQPEMALWALGSAAAGSTRNLYGAAILKAGTVRAATLRVESSEPPPRHAAIRGWPWHDRDIELQRAQQKECALQLASAAGPPFLK